MYLVKDIRYEVEVDERKIFNGSERKRMAGVKWIHLAEDRAQYTAAVNTVMNLRFPYNCGDVVAGQLPASQGGLSSVHGVSQAAQPVWCGTVKD
jgi:hypothetical protein